MDSLHILCAVALLSLPIELRGQALRLPVACVDADTALGPVSSRQSRASLRAWQKSDGAFMVGTPARAPGASGLDIFVHWSSSTIAESLVPEVVLVLSTATFDKLWAAGDTIVLMVDDWLVLSLGRPSPATLVSVKRPENMPVSVFLAEEDLRSLGGAKKASIRYGETRFAFDQKDLDAINALYRTIRCARAAARGST